MNTRTKTLSPATIISPHLYVERDADRQLRSVIESMGRPGYVLVARQMGKTNMLLHARQQLEGKENLFGYIDFSLPGESLREQLRMIVDEFINTHSAKFKKVASEIQARRKQGENSLPAHKEHENELRTLLAATSSRIVLIFDEIDALINTTYSDQLFSLVRSIYFSRANFPEYGRLTYVLSGVAEPSELIKNKNISPFNIGEKIYLDEFTFDEVQGFLKNAGLDLNQEIVQQIFFWTAGNPRMTWDVCSALEDELITGKTLTLNTVDNAVNRLYFGSIDRAPVDHIRTIAANQREVRDAIKDIRRGNGIISDQVRAKLYLSGIIAANFDQTSPRLKNRIIDNALSDSWLADVEKQKYSAFDLAKERLNNKKFKEALSLFMEHMAALPQEEDKALLYYQIGYCHFEEARYSEAKDWLQKQPIDPQESLSLSLHETYLIGMCNTFLDKYDDAISKFQEIIDAGPKQTYYCQALVNQAAARILAGGEKNIADAGETLRNFLANPKIEVTNMPEEEARKILISARFNYSHILEKTNNIADSIAQIESALNDCMDHEKPTLLTRLIALESDPDKKLDRTRAAIQFLAAFRPALAPRTASNPLSFDSDGLLALYAYVASLFDDETRQTCCSNLRKQYFNDLNSDARFTYQTALNFFNSGEQQIARRELTDFLERAGESATNELKLAIMKLILCRNERSDFDKIRSEYFGLHLKSLNENFDAVDFSVFSDRTGNLITQGKYKEALKLIHAANQYKSLISEEDRQNYILIDYFEMLIALKENNGKRATELASSLSGVNTEVYKRIKNPVFSVEDLETIKSQAEGTLKRNQRGTPVYNPFGELGRNDSITVRYKDGRVVTGKFKRLKADLESNRCNIVKS